MKKILWFYSIYLLLAGYYTANGQSLSATKFDSLNIYKERNDIVSCCRVLNELAQTANAQKDGNSLIALSLFLQKDFGVLSKDQQNNIRYEAARLGQKIFRLSGNVDESLKIYLVAHQYVENQEILDTLSWFIENPIASFYTMKGDSEKSAYFNHVLEQSLKYYKKYEFLSRFYGNMGTSLKTELKFDQAILALNKGLKLADSIDYNNGSFINALNLATLYNEHPELGSSVELLSKAGMLLSTLTSDKRYLEKKSAFDIESANLKSLQRNYHESIPLYREGIQTLSQYYPNANRREFAKYYTSLATAYFQSGFPDSAQQTITLGLATLIPGFNSGIEIPALNEVYPENSFIDLLSLRAKVYEKEFNRINKAALLEGAIQCIELAMDVNDMIRETLIADPSKLVTIRSNKELIAEEITDLYTLHSRNPVIDYFERARKMFNRSKSVLFNDKTRRNKIAELLSVEDRRRWASLQDTLGRLYDEKFETGVDLNSINGQILSCQEKINALFAGYTNRDLNTHMPENYIEYFMSTDEIYCLSSISNVNTFLHIGSIAEFDGILQRLNEFIHLKGLSMDDQLLNDMYRFFIAPLHISLTSEVVVIPDGAIGYVPFEMLRDEKGKYLLETTTISYAFEYITYDLGTVNSSDRLPVFCLAPKYAKKEAEGKESSRGSIYDLPYAKMEVDSILKLFGKGAITSQSADKGALEKMLDQSRVFHYAGHAIINKDKAYLALTDTGSENEQLTSNEIELKHHDLDLVVLSACETGLGKLDPGEGIRSLGRGFMESGARATIISLWNVNDKSTAMIMTGFYKYIRQGMRKDEALRQSKLDYLKNSPVLASHPYFWAAFIPAGDMMPLEKN